MTTRRFGYATRQSNRSPTVERSIRHRKFRHKRKQALGSAKHAYGVPLPESLHDAIEVERDNLSRAESLLGCLAVSMEYEADSVNAPYYPDVARLARDLVRQSINGLDSLSLQRHLLRDKVKEDCGMPIDRACLIAADYTGGGGASYGDAPSDLSMVVMSPGGRVLNSASRMSQ